MSNRPISRHALSAVAALLVSCLATLPALAADAPTKKGKAAAKAAPPAPVEVAVPDAQPDQVKAAEMVYYGKYDCEFQQTVHITQSPKYSAYVDVKAAKGGWLMRPVLSSTGAIRLEDVRGETLMVQISSKSMLLNVKTAQRVVDDCISPRQRELMEEAKAAKAAGEAAAVKAAAEAAAAKASADAAAASQSAGTSPAEGTKSAAAEGGSSVK